MKFKITFLLATAFQVAFAQDLPVNPQTGLISIQDSVDVKNKSLQEIQDVITQWGRTLLDLDNLKAIYKLDNSKQIETIGIELPVGSVLTQNKGNNKFLTKGTLTYQRIKNKGLNALSPSLTTGFVKFSFIYVVTGKKIFYEFTDLEYSPDGAYYGKYEDKKPPENTYNKSLFLKMGKKEFETVKKEYFDNLKILADNFKGYSANNLQNTQANTSPSFINYESYKKITTGMSYEDVVKLLVDEGKELSNTSTQVNGKSVTQQTIIWNDLDKTKGITIIFNDGKVASKSQTNL